MKYPRVDIECAEVGVEGSFKINGEEIPVKKFSVEGGCDELTTFYVEFYGSLNTWPRK